MLNIQAYGLIQCHRGAAYPPSVIVTMQQRMLRSQYPVAAFLLLMAFFLRAKIAKLKRQTECEGGHILILPSDISKEGGGLSARTLGKSSSGKGSEKILNEARKE